MEIGNRKNVVFDFGNVLIKWQPELLAKRLFSDPEEIQYVLNVVWASDWNARLDRGESFRALAHERIKEYPEYRDAIQAYINNWFDMIPGEVPGMMQLIRGLKSDGYHKVYGLSNFSNETYPTARERFGVLKEIDNYVISAECGYIKPQPEIYLYFLKKFQLEPEDCVFIDDSKINLDMAERFGFETIHFLWKKMFV